MQTNASSTVRVAILLSHHVTVAALCRARNLARLLLCAKGAGSERAEVVIGLPAMPNGKRRLAEEALSDGHPGIIVRPLVWEEVAVDNVQRMFPSLNPALDLDGIETVVIPRDWGWNFSDCDVWISFADPGIGAVLPLRPIAHFCRDLAVRIVPDAFATGINDPYWKRQTEAFRLWRQSGFVATSDSATIDDLVGFAGVRWERTAMMPPLMQPSFVSPVPTIVRNMRKLAWWVEPSSLHDITAAAEGLQLYLAEGGQFQPVIVSESVDAFHDEVAHPVLATIPPRLRAFLATLPLQAVSSEDALSRIVASSSVLWSSLLAGGDGEVAVASAHGGAHFVGLDYTINRFALESVGQSGVLYGRSLPTEIAAALHQAEKQAYQGPVVVTPMDQDIAVQKCGFILDRLVEVGRA